MKHCPYCHTEYAYENRLCPQCLVARPTERAYGTKTIKLLCQHPDEDIVYEIPVSYSDMESSQVYYIKKSLNLAGRGSLLRLMDASYQTDIRFKNNTGNVDDVLTDEQKADVRLILAYHYLLADDGGASFAALVPEFAPDPK